MRIIPVSEINKFLLNFFFLTVIEITIPKIRITKTSGKIIIGF